MNISVDAVTIGTVATIFGVAITYFNHRSNVKNNSKQAMKEILDEKVNNVDCKERHDNIQRFKERIGKESDDNGKAIQRIEKGMVLLLKNQGESTDFLMD